jgi:hypothetical protein
VLYVAAAQGVLVNDTDADGDRLRAELVTSPGHGSLALSPDGAFRYTPDRGYHGADSWTYEPNDGIADGVPVAVTLNVAEVSLPFVDVHGLTITAAEGRPLVNVAVVRFTDPDPSATIAGHAATIDWGDGTPPAPAVIAQPGGPGTPFFVTGSHTYVDAGVGAGTGRFVTRTRLLNPNGPDLIVTGTADVADVPIVLTGRLDSSSDTGRTNSDGITNDRTPTFMGTSEPGSIVRLLSASASGEASALIGNTIADKDGRWAITSNPLPDGRYRVSGTAVDAAGKTSAVISISAGSGDGLLVIDTAAPNVADVRFERMTGHVLVTFEDIGAGLDLASLLDRSDYSLVTEASRSRVHHNVTNVGTRATDVAQATADAWTTVAVTFDHGHTIRGGIYVFTARSDTLADGRGARDLAGNALAGKFDGAFPAGSAGRADDLKAQLVAFHHQTFAPQPIVGMPTPADVWNRIPMYHFFRRNHIMRLYRRYFGAYPTGTTAASHVAPAGHAQAHDHLSVHDAALSRISFESRARRTR